MRRLLHFSLLLMMLGFVTVACSSQTVQTVVIEATVTELATVTEAATATEIATATETTEATQVVVDTVENNSGSEDVAVVEIMDKPIDECLACHIDKDRLIETAKIEEEVVSESSGEG